MHVHNLQLPSRLTPVVPFGTYRTVTYDEGNDDDDDDDCNVAV